MGAKPKTGGSRWLSAPSPCIDVCKYPEGGPCKGCGMLKREKKAFKKIKAKEARKAFFGELVERLTAQKGKRLERWVKVYTRKCAQKGVPSPLEKIDGLAPPKGK
ncbi:MAG: DUF1289 domain-containing protein [Pseudomonadota bacterium]